MIKTKGDGFLAEFASPLAAFALRTWYSGKGRQRTPATFLRIGLNLGDVIIDESGDTYGDGVNIAARIESICDSGGVFLSGKFQDEVAGKMDICFEDRGEQALKNITKPVREFMPSPLG